MRWFSDLGQIVGGGFNPAFQYDAFLLTPYPPGDVNGDGVVNQPDVDYLVRNILQTRDGDTNLDQKVNFADFQVLLDHWEKAGT